MRDFDPVIVPNDTDQRRMFNPNTGVMLCNRIDHGTQIGAIDGLFDPDRLIGEIAVGGQIRLSSIQESCLAITTSSRFVSDVAAAVERSAKAVITYLSYASALLLHPRH